MSERDPKRLYFEVPSENVVTILKYELVDAGDWSENKYTIKENIETEYTYFIASDGLHNKINDLNVSSGDTIVIKKLQLEKYADGNPFFKVEMAPNQPIPAMSPSDKVIMDKNAIGEMKPNTLHKVDASPIGVGFAQKDYKAVEIDLKAVATSFHELSIRVENLEAEILKLKKDALPF